MDSIKDPDPSGSFSLRQLQVMAHWMRKREEARRNKEAGLPKPWTDDKIIQSARFCCVRRMDDKVSKWLLTKWYPRFQQGPPGELLGAAAMARLINWPDTLKLLPGNTLNVPNASRVLNQIKAAGGKVFTGAYIINASGHGKGASKIAIVLSQAHTLRMHPELVDSSSMEATHTQLMRVPGIGSFIAGQIVADLRHVWPGEWKDKMTWAPLGPGSRRGIGWLQGWDGVGELPNMNQKEFNALITNLIAWARENVADVFDDRQLEAHDMQNTSCETDKFFRLTYKTGRAKNKFNGV